MRGAKKGGDQLVALKKVGLFKGFIEVWNKAEKEKQQLEIDKGLDQICGLIRRIVRQHDDQPFEFNKQIFREMMECKEKLKQFYVRMEKAYFDC